MSLGGGKSAALEQAVANSPIPHGITTYAVGAGNETEDACHRLAFGTRGSRSRSARRRTDAPALQRLPRLHLHAGSASYLTDTVHGDDERHIRWLPAACSQGWPRLPAGARRARRRRRVRERGLFTLTTKNIVTDAQSTNAHLLFSNL